MKDIFMCLLLNLANHGKITEANMYEGGSFSTIKIKADYGTFRVSVTKEEKENNDE